MTQGLLTGPSQQNDRVFVKLRPEPVDESGGRMRDVRVVLKTPAGEGNTCYRPDTDASELQDLIAESLKRVEPGLEFSFEVVVTESEEQLLINDRPLREWTEGLDETHRHHYHESVRPAIASGRYTVLEERGFLDAVLESVIKQS